MPVRFFENGKQPSGESTRIACHTRIEPYVRTASLALVTGTVRKEKGVINVMLQSIRHLPVKDEKLQFERPKRSWR